MVFLLAWDKDTCTGRFLALLPCACLLQPTLALLYQTSSFLLGSLPIVASANLRLLTPQQEAHQPHSSLKFPSLSLFLQCVFSS
jgi:hypothetical protein